MALEIPLPQLLSLSLYVYPQKHTGNAMLQWATVVMSGGGFKEWDTFQENIAASWKKKDVHMLDFFF